MKKKLFDFLYLINVLPLYLDDGRSVKCSPNPVGNRESKTYFL